MSKVVREAIEGGTFRPWNFWYLEADFDLISENPSDYLRLWYVPEALAGGFSFIGVIELLSMLFKYWV